MYGIDLDSIYHHKTSGNIGLQGVSVKLNKMPKRDSEIGNIDMKSIRASKSNLDYFLPNENQNLDNNDKIEPGPIYDKSM